MLIATAEQLVAQARRDEFLPARAALEVRWAADLITRLDSIPAAQLAAGDSTVLRSGVACLQGANTPTCLT